MVDSWHHDWRRAADCGKFRIRCIGSNYIVFQINRITLNADEKTLGLSYVTGPSVLCR